jgi:lactoylglutathione lyase
VDLAKPCIDVGLFTDDLDASLRFWQDEVGLPFEELLPTGGGNQQHRHAMNGSVLKLNHPRQGLPAAPASGYRELWIARAGIPGPRLLHEPHGRPVRLVPPGTEGVGGVGVQVAVRDPAAQRRFYAEGLGLEEEEPGTFRCGTSLLRIVHDPAATGDAPLVGPGYRYLTIQVRDCAAVHREVLARGGQEGAAPRRLGDVAIISMVRDPDGNWIELSQRASLTGPLG